MKNKILWIVLAFAVFLGFLVTVLYTSQKVDVEYSFKSLINLEEMQAKWDGDKLTQAVWDFGEVTLTNDGQFQKTHTFPEIIGCIKKVDVDAGTSAFFSDKLLVAFYPESDDSWKTTNLYYNIYRETEPTKVILEKESSKNFNLVASYRPGGNNEEFYNDKILSLVFFKLKYSEENPFDFDFDDRRVYRFMSCQELSNSLKPLVEIVGN